MWSVVVGSKVCNQRAMQAHNGGTGFARTLNHPVNAAITNAHGSKA
jgi:hypothetical protein